MRLDHLIWPKVGWGYMEPHESVFDIFRYIRDTINPKTWLEIGFHLGHSTTYTLEIMPEVKLTGIGITKCRNADRYEIGDNMKSMYSDRFEYFLGDPPDVRKLLKGRTFDVAFVDGDHKYESAVNDITACMEMKVPYILVDNCELERVNSACKDYLGMYKHDKFLYDSYWNGHKMLEARLYHVQYNNL
jgi:predicted O-methyltransferase YrrM